MSDGFEKRMDSHRVNQLKLGMSYRGDLQEYLEGVLKKRDIKYTEKEGKADQRIEIASGVGEIGEIMLLINPPKKGIVVSFIDMLLVRKDETINDIRKQIYAESKLSPLYGDKASIIYVQSASDGKYEKVVGIELVKP